MFEIQIDVGQLDSISISLSLQFIVNVIYTIVYWIVATSESPMINLISGKTAETLNTKATKSIIPDLHQKFIFEILHPASSIPVLKSLGMHWVLIRIQKNNQFK